MDQQLNKPNTGAIDYREGEIAQRHEAYDDEIDLVELFQALYKRKFLIIGLSFLLGVVVAGYSLTIPNEYKAQASLMPVSSGGGMGGLGQYAGLASLAGVSLPKGESSKSEEALAVLNSYQFLSEFITQNQLKPLLFVEAWDVETQSWIVSEPGLVSNILGSLRGQGNEGDIETLYEGQEVLAPGEPSLQQSVKKLKAALQVNDGAKTSVVTIALEWQNPVLARDWVNRLVREINDHMRQKEMESAQRSIRFLEAQIEQIALVEHRQVAYKIIEENLKNLTLAQTESDYVFKVIDPAIVPEDKSKPKRSLMVAVALVLGFMLGVFIALILNWREKNSADSSQV